MKTHTGGDRTALDAVLRTLDAHADVFPPSRQHPSDFRFMRRRSPSRGTFYIPPTASMSSNPTPSMSVTLWTLSSSPSFRRRGGSTFLVRRAHVNGGGFGGSWILTARAPGYSPG